MPSNERRNLIEQQAKGVGTLQRHLESNDAEWDANGAGLVFLSETMGALETETKQIEARRPENASSSGPPKKPPPPVR